MQQHLITSGLNFCLPILNVVCTFPLNQTETVNISCFLNIMARVRQIISIQTTAYTHIRLVSYIQGFLSLTGCIIVN